MRSNLNNELKFSGIDRSDGLGGGKKSTPFVV